MTAAYVHVPFCGRVCPYCDFAVVAGQDALMDSYMAAVVSEIGREDHESPLEAVFVGGGTPSRLASGDLRRIIDALADRFGFADDVEISLEANPEDWNEALASNLVAGGFNRVSFGAQSFDPVVLDYLGRQHVPSDIERAVRSARDAGFASVSLDLIFGSPVESLDSWSETLDFALSLQPDHISTYALTVERGTELSRLVAAGAEAPDSDDQADKYQLAQTRLPSFGLEHYEVSNYARSGHACRYNLNTWAQGDYLGFGLGAHGHINGWRRRNVRNLETYLVRIANGDSPELARELIGGWDRLLEKAFLGVRLRAGVEAGRVTAALLADSEGRQLVDTGVVELVGERLRVADPLLTDGVARVILGLAEPDPAFSTRN